MIRRSVGGGKIHEATSNAAQQSSNTASIASLTTSLHDLQSTAPSQPSFHVRSHCQLSAREAQKSTTSTTSHTSWPSLGALTSPPLQKTTVTTLPIYSIPKRKAKELALGPHLWCQQITEISFHRVSREGSARTKRRNPGYSTHYLLPVLLSVAKLSLAVICGSKAYSPLRKPLRCISYTGATVEVR